MSSWRFIAAKATGTSHKNTSLECQDYFNYFYESNFLVLALADGAGSAKFGGEGARLAVTEVVREVVYNLYYKSSEDILLVLRNAAIKARNEVFTLAQTRGVLVREFSSTLLVAVLSDMGGATLQIGDGVIVAREMFDNSWCWQTWPMHGEFVNTTRFLTDLNALEQLEIETLPSTTSDLVLLSDGLERLALDMMNKNVFNPFFDGMIKPIISCEGSGRNDTLSLQLESFLHSERISSRTDDDVSLILATNRESTILS
jgi:hypothetical protein